MEMISIKEAQKLTKKSNLTIRRAVYAADDQYKSQNEKGHWFISKEYIISKYSTLSNDIISDDQPQKSDNDKAMSSLSIELQNKQRTIEGLNDRLSEANQIIEGQRKQLEGLELTIAENNQKLLEAGEKEPVIIEKEIIKEVPTIEERVVTVETTDTVKIIGSVLFGMAITVGCIILAIYIVKG